MKSHIINEKRKQFLLLILMLTLSSITTDLYTPSFRDMVDKLKTTMNQVQWSLSIFILTLGVSQLFYGPLSEFLGRRRVILFGLVLSIIGSFLCYFAPSIDYLIIGRAIQGLGVGACAVLWRTIFRDTYEGAELARVSSYLAPVAILTVVLAPFVGGVIQSHWGWRANFGYLLFHVIFVFLCLYFGLQESKKKDPEQNRFSLKKSLLAYKELFTSRLFMGYCFCIFLTYGALFSWTISGPVVLMDGMKVSPYEFGKIMLLTGLPMGVGGFLNGKLVIKHGVTFLLRLAWAVMFLAALSIVLLGFMIPQNLWTVVVPLLVFVFASGFVWPNVFSSAFTPFGHISGVASALYGVFQLSGAAFFGAVLSVVKEQSQIPMGIIMCCCIVGAFVIHELVVTPTSRRKEIA